MQVLKGLRRDAFQLITRKIQRQQISQRQLGDRGQAIVRNVQMNQGVLQAGERARRDNGQHVAGQLDADEILEVVEQPRRDLAHEIARQAQGHELRRRGANQFRGERGDAVELHVQVGEGRQSRERRSGYQEDVVVLQRQPFQPRQALERRLFDLEMSNSVKNE